jgi:hypothetical protein
VRQLRLIVGLGAALAVTLIVIAGIAMWLILRQRRAAKPADFV